jgi:hypothetical protein
MSDIAIGSAPSLPGTIAITCFSRRSPSVSPLFRSPRRDHSRIPVPALKPIFESGIILATAVAVILNVHDNGFGSQTAVESPLTDAARSTGRRGGRGPEAPPREASLATRAAKPYMSE